MVTGFEVGQWCHHLSVAGLMPEATWAERRYARNTAVRVSPFSHLLVPAQKSSDVDPGLIEDWVRPLYMHELSDGHELAELIRPRSAEVNSELVLALLSPRNWRPRKVGAYLAALKLDRSVEDLLGRLLLRSDLCCAGPAYCLALARLNSASSIQVLCEYLDYYLSQPDLCFDQGVALAAVHHLDAHNGTELGERYRAPWQQFIANKPHWNLSSACAHFDSKMATLSLASRLLGWN